MNKHDLKKIFNKVKKDKVWIEDEKGGLKYSKKLIEDFENLSNSSLKIDINTENSLYKYLPIDGYSIENLKNSELFFNFAGNFKDDFDSLLKIMSKVEPIYKDKIGTKLEKLFQRDTLVTCFTEKNSDKTMWKRYAGNHKGFCLEFSFKDFQKKYLYEQIKKEDNHTENICPVIYDNDIYDGAKFFPRGRGDGFFEKINDDEFFILRCVIQPLIYFVTLTKKMKFLYENEWRWFKLYTYDLKDEDNFKVLENKKGVLRKVLLPKAIYLGKNIEEKNKKEIIEICKSKGIKVYQMKLEKNILEAIPIEIGYLSNSVDKKV